MFGLKKKRSEEVVEEALTVIEEEAQTPIAEHSNDEVIAAIAIALNLYQTEAHDLENMVITIQKVIRPYSPWSSKIYGLRQYPIKMRTNYEKIQIKNK